MILIDEAMLRHIKSYTEEEAHRQLEKNEWSTILDELDVFISILYTRARCRFTQCMASKPEKFGIKFWRAADVGSKYVLNGFPYLCKDEKHPVNLSLSEHVVLLLIKPSENKARNTTTDNFFTTLNLSQMLKTERTLV
ncbi:piggyBac transposable element-derived protein 4 [Trichonephila clavipes]|nr:piggyBac transposable element-derived protein 4 [Trichonephila clavipes]